MAKDLPSIPADFPRDPHPGALTGAMPKLPARKIGDAYIVGLTDEELAQRYDVCHDLVTQLVAYCQRKLGENPDWSQQQAYERTKKGLVSKQHSWNLSAREVDWILRNLIAQLEWQVSA